jgi:hypothetical protein
LIIHSVAPAVVEKRSVGQSTHVAAPLEVCPDGPYLPATQAEPEHVEAKVAPTAIEYFPEEHFVHLLCPETGPNVPLGHFEHTSMMAMMGAMVPAGHTLHTARPSSFI